METTFISEFVQNKNQEKNEMIIHPIRTHRETAKRMSDKKKKDFFFLFIFCVVYSY